MALPASLGGTAWVIQAPVYDISTAIHPSAHTCAHTYTTPCWPSTARRVDPLQLDGMDAQGMFDVKYRDLSPVLTLHTIIGGLQWSRLCLGCIMSWCLYRTYVCLDVFIYGFSSQGAARSLCSALFPMQQVQTRSATGMVRVCM